MQPAGSTVAPAVSSCRFGPVTIEYDARVLAPREWTLAQSRWAAELADRVDAGPLLELCAGAGQIGLAAAVLADRDLVQVEADPVAAGFARHNARGAGWDERVEIRISDLSEALRSGERFPLVLADPPYLPTRDTARWPDDPETAIDGGEDGLEITRACLDVAACGLAPGGWMLLQVAGPAQALAVARVAAPRFACEGLRVTDRERAVQLLRRH